MRLKSTPCEGALFGDCELRCNSCPRGIAWRAASGCGCQSLLAASRVTTFFHEPRRITQFKCPNLSEIPLSLSRTQKHLTKPMAISGTHPTRYGARPLRMRSMV